MDLKSNFGGSKGSIDGDKSIIDKLSVEMKLLFFNVISWMLKDDDQSLLLNGIAILIQFIQITYIPFNRKIWEVWQNEIISKQLNKFFGYLLFTTNFSSMGFGSFVAIMYVILGLIVFSLMLVFMLSYGKDKMSWPIYLLRIIVFLLINVLYMPTMDMLFSMVACETNIYGTLVHQIFDVECWSNVHIVHGIVAIFAMILFFSLSLFYVLLYYEARFQTSDVQSKQSGRAQAIFQIYITIMIICYSFMLGSSYDYLQILIMMLGSFIVFWKIHVEQPFNNVAIQKMWSMLAAMNMWTVTLLCFAKFLEGVLFFGTVYACVVGLPLMMLAVLRSEKQHFDLLLLNLNKVSDSDQILSLTNHLLKLYTRSSQDQNSSLLIDGFLEIHRSTCNRDDCYLKQKKTNQGRKLHQFKENISERDIDFLMVMGQIYFNSIKKFPNEIQLRLKYAFFLLDFMKQRQQALNELQQADQLCPSIDQEFIIYRYKMIIEREINDQQNESLGSQDVVSELAFQSNMRQLQNKIERATLMHMDFWSQLQEDSPDLGKLNDIGAKINLAIQQVDELWNKMQKNSQNLPKVMRLYGKFTIDVLQDKDYGEGLMEKARQIQIQNNKMKNKAAIQIVSSEDIGFEPLPIILASTSQDKFAQITNVNLASCNLFGYHKTELINRKINMLMPNLYSKMHDAYIEKFLSTNDTKQLSRERQIYLKLKSNYVLPCLVNLKVIQSLDENIQIAAQFKTQKTNKISCLIILDAEDIIDSISSTCIPLLNIDAKQVLHKKTSIREVFPNFNKNRDQFLAKNGAQLIFNQQSLQTSQNNLNDEENKEVVFQAYLIEILNESQDTTVGFILKLDTPTNQQDNSVSGQDLQIPQKLQLMNNFQFKMNPNKKIYQGEFNLADTNSARVDQTVIWEQGDQSSFISYQGDPQNTQLKSQVKTEKSDDIQNAQIIKYGEGIRTLRLYENRVQEIDDKEENISEEDEPMQGRSVFQNNQDQDQDPDNSLSDQNNVFKSRKNLYSVVNNQQTPSVISKLQWTASILTLILVTLSFVDYFITLTNYDDIFQTIKLLQTNGQRTSEMQSVIAYVQNLIFVNMGIFTFNTTQLQQTYVALQRTKLNTSISLIQDLNDKLTLTSVYISDKIDVQYTQNVVKMYTNQNTSVMYDLNQATQQIISKAIIVRDKNLSQITMNDTDVYFVIFNLMNDLLFQLRNTSIYYQTGLQNKAQDKQQIFGIVLGVSAGALGLGLIVLSIVLLQVNQIQESILQMFLDIPDKTVKYLYNKSENFISNLQIGEEDDVLSEMEDQDKEEQAELNKSLKGKKKKKKFKNTNKDQRNYIFSMIIILAILQSYFIFNYFMSGNLLQNIGQQSVELYATQRGEGFYRSVDNQERLLYLNRNMTLLDTDSYTTVKNNINGLYALDSQIHQEHSLNVAVTNQIYSDAFTQMFMLEPCTVLSSVQQEVTYDACKAFADGAIFQGMAVGLARYFENLRYMLTIYDQFIGVPSANFTAIARGFATFRNITKNTDNVTNNILNLNNFNQSVESRTMQDNYLRGTFRYLMNKFIEALGDDIDKQKTQRLAIFIVFEVLLFIIYFILWLPLLMKLTRDVWRTRSMIIMIPLKVILKIKSIKMYIRDFIHAKDVQV